MSTKNLIAIVAGFVASFLLSWLVYGMLLKDTMAAGTMMGLNRPQGEFVWAAVVGGTLLKVVFFTLLLSKMGINDFKGGFMNALWIGFMVALYYDLFLWGTSHMFNNVEPVCIDVIAASVTSALVGGVIGLMLGRGTESATA